MCGAPGAMHPIKIASKAHRYEQWRVAAALATPPPTSTNKGLAGAMNQEGG